LHQNRIKNRCRIIRRGSRSKSFYCVDSQTGSRTSLGKIFRDKAGQIVGHKDTALRQPILNLQIAKASLAGTDFEYRTRKSWSRARRVVGKAEILEKGRNPRFIVTNLSAQESRFEAASLYEKFYCARGEMENRIKEAQMDLFAERTSTHWMASNQLRLWFSAFAHLLLSVLRAEVLRGSDPAQASIAQIRLKLFKIAARVKVSCRRIHVELAGAYPYRETFRRAWANLCAMPAG
jgi:hypothetical protein